MNALGLCANALAFLGLADTGGTYWMPPQASSVAPKIDGLFYIILYISVFFFTLIVGLMVLFLVLYRARPGHKEQPSPHHNTMLEIVWSGIPFLLILVIFWYSFKGYMYLKEPPADAYQVAVDAQKWSWLFTYPNGYSDENLHVPAGKPVALTMTSADVLHAFFVPDFRVKQDVVPGRFTKVWFRADNPGEHQIYCAEYCGQKHSFMWAKVFVHEPAEFDKWLAEASDFIKKLPPDKAGEKLFKMRGCIQCHTIDGKAGTGPTLKGAFGHSAKLSSGESVIVDENYIRQSILDPGSQVVSGFQPVMPTFQGRLKEEEIRVIIEYIKTLK